MQLFSQIKCNVLCCGCQHSSGNMSGKVAETADIHLLNYSAADLIEKPCNWDHTNSNPSGFDQLLQRKWKEREDNGILKYKLSSCKYKTIKINGNSSNTAGYVAQLNPQRAFNRRKRESFATMNETFSENQFNFTKIHTNEILFKLKPSQGTALKVYSESLEPNPGCSDHSVAVNISPIDNCHVLLIPNLNECQPQRMNMESLLLAFDFAQLSSHPGFRVGFNSLHAWASVNHLHYHAMYYNYKLFVDEIKPTRHLAGGCHIVESDFMMPGFLFNLSLDVQERLKVAKQLTQIVDVLHTDQIPYNLMIVRSTEDLGTRVILWPRMSTKGLKPSPCFDVACVEVGGQLPIKTEAEFDGLTFEKVQTVFKETALKEKTMNQLVEAIKSMF